MIRLMEPHWLRWAKAPRLRSDRSRLLIAEPSRPGTAQASPRDCGRDHGILREQEPDRFDALGPLF